MVKKKSSFKGFLSCFSLMYSGGWENEETNTCTCIIADVKPMH